LSTKFNAKAKFYAILQSNPAIRMWLNQFSGAIAGGFLPEFQ